MLQIEVRTFCTYGKKAFQNYSIALASLLSAIQKDAYEKGIQADRNIYSIRIREEEIKTETGILFINPEREMHTSKMTHGFPPFCIQYRVTKGRVTFADGMGKRLNKKRIFYLLF